MATKPSTLPRPWCTNATYLTGPFAGSPGKVDPGAGVAADGHRPGAAYPTAAEHENYQQNLVTASWIPWVNSGTSLGTAAASIVERNALGKTAFTGYDVLGLVDATAITIAGPNTLAPLVTATSSGGGVIFQTNQTTTSNSYNVVMNGAASGAAFSCTATATSTGTCHSVTIPTGSSSPGMTITNAGGAHSLRVDSTKTGAPGVIMTSQQGPALTLDGQGPNATPLVLTPRNLSYVAAGSFWIDNTTIKAPMFYDTALVQRTCWASVSGMLLASAFTAGPTTFSVATNAASVSVDVVTGQRYLITMGVEVGRGNGTTPDILVTATAGASTLNISGFTIKTFETTAVAGQTERGWTKSTVFTAVSTGNISIVLNLTPSPLVNATYAQAFITVAGHYV